MTAFDHPTRQLAGVLLVAVLVLLVAFGHSSKSSGATRSQTNGLTRPQAADMLRAAELAGPMTCPERDDPYEHDGPIEPTEETA